MAMLPKAYEPKDFEMKWYKYWEDHELFKAHVRPGKPRFSMVIPPPNVTGALHMGHALDTTLQDILVRYQRMLGYETLWLPGTDHASIATHAKIEEMLANEGTSRWQLGREKFLERAWQWKEKYGHIITDQLRTMGASCDWSRERFTMDKGCSQAVNEVFVRLYEKGLIYRDKYMVNFCPGCHTVISDIEVEHEETDGSLYYIRYPVKEGASLVVATTRPETMLGDTAIAVHPEDPRYAHLIGKTAILPLVGRELPIIGDEHVDPKFGTGAVKVTPSHDMNDFEMGLKHNLAFIDIIDTSAKMTEEAGEYAGLDRFECRKKLVFDLESQGYLVKKEPYKISLAHCHRCDSVVEPLISEQWFVRMKPLAEPAVSAVKEGKVQFVPERFAKIYLHWMENVRDWCISRQLWWGHRIPAWYCQNCGEMIVAREAPEKCPRCGGEVKQDEDVLDTWFSSALWPFSTLGWPNDTPDLRYFFPTDVLVTGYDIIFFWVARMVFSSMEFMKEPPFHHVLIHGLVRDALGRKMSKSLGNGIDPLDVVDKYGADALRMSLVSGVAMGNDMRFYDEKVEGQRNFCNKLWNAARFVLSNLEGFDPDSARESSLDFEVKGIFGRWILSRLERTIEGVENAMQRFEPGEAIDLIQSFIWDEFCDWYIELSKEDLKNPALSGETKMVLWATLKDSLSLLHPFAPFVTEELWSHLPKRISADGSAGDSLHLITAEYPTPKRYKIDQEAEDKVSSLIQAIKAIRNMRREVNIPVGKAEKAIILTEEKDMWMAFSPYIQRLSWSDPFLCQDAKKDPSRPKRALTQVISGAEVYLPLEGIIDLEREIERLEKTVQETEKDVDRTEERLKNADFLSKAPEEIVERMRKRWQEGKDKLDSLSKRVKILRDLR